MTFDATPRGAAATSYTTVEEADAYHAAQPPGTRTFVPAAGETDWATLSTEAKQHRLMLATRLLDQIVVWTGSRYYGHPDTLAARGTQQQSLEWPRYDMFDRTGRYEIDIDTIPQQLKDATAEFAGQLGDLSRTQDDAVETASLSGIRVGPVNLAFDRPEAKRIPDSVVYMLYPHWYSRLRHRSKRSISTVRITR